MLVLCIAALLGRCAWAEDRLQNPNEWTPTDPDLSTRQYEKHWFFYTGATNYHARLEPSEKQIDEQINGLFGSLLPRWREPETFKDWSDDWKLWDVWIGFGRDINAKWTWGTSVGGGEGTVKNSHTYYPFLIPTDIDVNFTRMEAYIEGALSWYLWGKPEIADRQDGKKGLHRALKATRPFFDLAVGYDYQVSEANVAVKMPLIGTVFREHQKDDYHLLYFNPRIGIETPIDNKNSVGMTAGYVFFHEHGDEFNSSLVNVFFRHRF